ncbi:DUF4026 domain-containing protein [Affinibrenneria salicis]|uniref:DUF4026 domain-containing protein n=1 Tax=Affinibrenneria salicis TaxID=2590031 RepID=A0A5J5FQU3_9GAMM|nr:DUF4026 domain-containing protein [Affinibrenneria salicis]KAA8995164.1 DUF4026 domain-containing protein [Affinibrenneria salicis]
MDNKQQYLDIAAGEGKREPSMMVAFSAREVSYPLLEQRLQEQTFFTQGEVDYLSDDKPGFTYTCRHGEDELCFVIALLDRDPGEEIKPYFSTDPLSPELLARVNATGQDIVVECVFQQHPLVSYCYQLRLLQILAPDLLLGIDISAAGKGFTREWLNFMLADDVLPDIDTLYTIHAIYDAKNDPPTSFWFHTHGLARCGLTEAELVIPDALSSWYGIPNLLCSFVNNSIEQQRITFNEPILCGQTDSGYEYLVALPYEEGLRHVNQSTPLDQLRPLEEMRFDLDGVAENQFTGDRADRDENHRHPASMLFRTNEEHPVLETFFKGYEDQNAIMFLRTNRETGQMAHRAQSRWHYFTRMFENYGVSTKTGKPGFFSRLLKKAPAEEKREWGFMVKCGIPHGEQGEEREHMWFILENMQGDTFNGRLINQPFYVKSMKDGGVYSLEPSLITDWTIYYQDNSYTPNTIYQLFSGELVH